MRLKLFKTLCFVSAIAAPFGCSTTQVRERKRERVEVCVPDPRNDALQCQDEKQNPITRPFQTLIDGKYLCFPAAPITRILGDE